MGGSPEAWQAYDAAREALDLSYRLGIKEEIKKAMQVVAPAVSSPASACKPHLTALFLCTETLRNSKMRDQGSKGPEEFLSTSTPSRHQRL